VREIIKETLELLKEVDKELDGNNLNIEKSISNLKIVINEYKRLIEDFIEESSN
tara:strand:- start:767 stop:928 length:162 start_codon:yes stop_codon:yes gene_type:complete